MIGLATLSVLAVVVLVATRERPLDGAAVPGLPPAAPEPTDP